MEAYVQRSIGTPPPNLVSLVRRLYSRVARHLDLDPSYVSRVARSERQSEAIEAALKSEMIQVVKMVKTNHDGLGRHNSHEPTARISMLTVRQQGSTMGSEPQSVQDLHQQRIKR